MRKVITLTIIALFGAMIFQHKKINELKIERDKYERNTSSLLKGIDTYKTTDSLNAAKIGVLELTVSEYKKNRNEDRRLIETLRLNNRKLESITSIQNKTIIELKGSVRDSIVYRDNYRVDTLRCIDIHDEWFELHGCVSKDMEFKGKFENRDSIKVVGTIEYKRFLGFLWYTNTIKNREIDIVSKNPHTNIVGAEYIEIRK